MSGLFTTLMAAALGEADAAVPMPNARFPAPLGDDIDWCEGHATEHPRQRLVVAKTDAAEPALLDRRWPKSETVSEERSPGLAETIVPPQFERSKPIASKPQPASAAVAVPEPDPIAPTSSKPALRAPGRRPAAAKAVTQPLGRRTPSRETDTLLPLVATTIRQSLQDQAPDIRTTGVDQRRASGVMLRIGRIEVRSATQQHTPPPSRPATVATSRGSTPGRATVRQSLDDYRNQRGR